MANNTHLARKLRRDLTDAERKLWFRLRDRRLAGLKFRRQIPIGPYIVDFCCEASKLVIEIDGGQHATQVASDRARTEELAGKGYLVLRYWNNDVLSNIDGVIEDILSTLNKSPLVPPHPDPLPNGEREPVLQSGATSIPLPSGEGARAGRGRVRGDSLHDSESAVPPHPSPLPDGEREHR